MDDYSSHDGVGLADLVRNLVVGDRLSGVHDVSTGGLAVALAELAVHSGVGTEVAVVPSPAHLFAEHPARVVVSVPAGDVPALESDAAAAGVGAVRLGTAGGDRFTVGGPAGPLIDLALDDLTRSWRSRLPDALGEGTTQA